MIIDSVHLTGERIFLRPMTREDSSFIVSWRNDPEIKKWMFNQRPLTIEEHLKWFEKPKPDRLDYVICDKENSLPIGTVNFINMEAKRAEAGKMLGDKNYWGGGFAREAFSLWLNAGFKILKLQTIYVKTMTANTANIKLNEKLGFTAVKTDHVELEGAGKTDVLIMELDKEKFYELYK